MSTFKPFKSVRPLPAFAEKVAALPYDVMTSAEAREEVVDNPYSFLHVDKAEIDLSPDIDIYSDEVYEKAASNLNSLETDEIMKQDTSDCFYIYEQTWKGSTQTGIVGCASIDEYINGKIKKHELTRADKEADRIRHVDTCDANTGPIFLTYKGNNKIDSIIKKYKTENAPVYEFTSSGDVKNRIWVVNNDRQDVDALKLAFEDVDALYIADGHHRCASAVKVGQKRREENPNYTGEEEFNFFLAVAFPKEELRILDYNRVIKDLNGLSKEDFLKKINEKFQIETTLSLEPYAPEARHTFGMLLEGKWYKLTAKDGTFPENDPVDSLDVSILQNNLISPVLGIDDPRTDKRIDFVGGIRGLSELERRCNEDMELAFSMFPTSLDELISIADAGKLMPPKSTWFEPKLLSGLFIHKLK
ncbi:MAG: DUF1015 domain-containing protein [Oscillospiraceae bacterium]|nr:DUF1015 domain-containing protein [Candidatus Limimonas coprohippi]